ncbi:uncharacterized protein LOC135709827 [Ochlerotatus camptorhynchus]|uniref:uncharacterized protein LOC135709827 n=1 Tax=Ochlerotatus camptorhynchus TaxID=644619 RepID=UPI0031DD5C26
MSAEIKQLREENCKLRHLNMKLQESLVEKPMGLSFSDIPGYPNSNWLLRVSQDAHESDYLFVKELLFSLFPRGVGNATVTGRCSNNPRGRSKKAPEPNQNIKTVVQMDPEKVKYMKARLYERRRILQDPVGVAQHLSQQINKHIATALANNPVLRQVPTQ